MENCKPYRKIDYKLLRISVTLVATDVYMNYEAQCVDSLAALKTPHDSIRVYM